MLKKLLRINTGMKLSTLASPDTSHAQLEHPITGLPIEAYVWGYTPDSKEWLQKAKELAAVNDKQAIIIEKDRQLIEIDEAKTEQRRELLLWSIQGLVGFDDVTAKNLQETLENPAYSFVLEQWMGHVDDRKKYCKNSGKPPKNTSKS